MHKPAGASRVCRADVPGVLSFQSLSRVADHSDLCAVTMLRLPVPMFQSLSRVTDHSATRIACPAPTVRVVPIPQSGCRSFGLAAFACSNG